MSDFSRSQEFRVCVTVFVVLSMAYMVEGDPVLKIASVGDSITLNCNRHGATTDNYKNWYQNGILIANWDGVKIDDPRYTQRNVYGRTSPDSNIIYISNVRISDSSLFTCKDYYNRVILSYDVRVIGCSNCILAIHNNPNKTKVICSLDNYWAEQNTPSRVTFYYAIRPTDYYAYRNTVITKNMFSFQVYKTEWEIIHTDFYLDINNNQEKRITCTLPSPPTTPSHISTTQQTTQNTPLILTSTVSVQAESATSPSVSTKDDTPKNTDSSSDEITNDANMTIIIVVLGFVFILVLVIIIVALRCRQTRNRQKNLKHNGKASIKKDHPGDYYESVEEGPLNKGPEYATSIKELKGTSVEQRVVDHPQHGEMVENILYNSREQITDSSIPRMEGPLDNALYALPDKRATIGRETKTIDRETTSIGPDRSSDSNLLYGNSDIITQHQPNKDTLRHQTDQYENVDLPGSGGTEEIPLYGMPDKGPIGNASKDTPKARQTSTLSRDDGVSVDALYAEVDKSKKK